VTGGAEITRENERLKADIRADCKIQFQREVFLVIWNIAWVVLLVLSVSWIFGRLEK